MASSERADRAPEEGGGRGVPPCRLARRAIARACLASSCAARVHASTRRRGAPCAASSARSSSNAPTLAASSSAACA